MATFKPTEMRAIEEGGNAVRLHRIRSLSAQWFTHSTRCCSRVVLVDRAGSEPATQV